MPRSAETYTSSAAAAVYHAQAARVWAVTASVVVVWLFLIVLPPLLAASGNIPAASPFYTFFGGICHQIADRTFFIAGHPMAVCSRCFGVYFGLVTGTLLYPLWRSVADIEPLPRTWLILSVVPMAVDWSLTFFGIWENTFATRFVTGLILGAACATYIIPAVVEIARNFRRSPVAGEAPTDR